MNCDDDGDGDEIPIPAGKSRRYRVSTDQDVMGRMHQIPFLYPLMVRTVDSPMNQRLLR
jgi:hypothetical protein